MMILAVSCESVPGLRYRELKHPADTRQVLGTTDGRYRSPVLSPTELIAWKILSPCEAGASTPRMSGPYSRSEPVLSPLLSSKRRNGPRKMRDPFRLRGNDAGEVRSKLAGDVPG